VEISLSLAARRATALQLAALTELDPRRWAVGREERERDALQHVTSLDEAVRQDSPAMFASYIGRAKVLLASRSTPDHAGEELVSSLVSVRAAIAEQVGEGTPMLLLLDTTIELVPAMPATRPSMIDPSAPHAELARRYLDMFLGNRRRDASAMILEAVESGASVQDIYLHVFQPAQYEIGRLWELNELSAAQAHLATATTQMIMSQLYLHVFTHSPLSRTIVAACVSEDLHELGCRVLVDFFAMEGWDSHYLGASTPPDILSDFAAKVQADVVALSVSMIEHIPRLLETIAAVREASPDTVILVGGYPFRHDPQLCQSVGADGTATDASTAMAVAWQLVEARRAVGV
jgi:methanogenic corrinoid protein MtbC1